MARPIDVTDVAEECTALNAAASILTFHADAFSHPIAFSSEVVTGSREENASK
jgi:hypothetical protein